MGETKAHKYAGLPVFQPIDNEWSGEMPLSDVCTYTLEYRVRIFYMHAIRFTIANRENSSNLFAANRLHQKLKSKCAPYTRAHTIAHCDMVVTNKKIANSIHTPKMMITTTATTIFDFSWIKPNPIDTCCVSVCISLVASTYIILEIVINISSYWNFCSTHYSVPDSTWNERCTCARYIVAVCIFAFSKYHVVECVKSSLKTRIF